MLHLSEENPADICEASNSTSIYSYLRTSDGNIGNLPMFWWETYSPL